MMRRRSTSKPLTPPVEDQLRQALVEAGTEAPFAVTTRWGWIMGPARDTNPTDPYPVELYLHRPTTVLSDAAKAQENHVTTARYAAGAMIVGPAMIAMLWILYLPIWPLGLAAAAAAGWGLWKWVLPRAAISPLDKAILITVIATDATPASIVTAVLGVPFVRELDNLGVQLTDDDASHTQYVEAWKSHWATAQKAHQ